MNNINNFRLATAALVAMFVCDLSTTNIYAMDQSNPMVEYEKAIAKNVVTLNIRGADVSFDKTNSEECFKVLEQVCNGPKDFKIDNYVFPLAEKALSYNKDKVFETLRSYFMEMPAEDALVAFGVREFLSNIPLDDRIEFWLDFNDRKAVVKSLDGCAPGLCDTERYRIEALNRVNPKTPAGQELRDSLKKHYETMLLLRNH